MLNFEPVSRDRMFYDQYQYGICISLEESSVLRQKTLGGLHSAIEYRNVIRTRYWGGSNNAIDDKIKRNLIAVWHELDAVRNSIKLVISFNILYIYSNDVAVLQHIADIPQVKFNNAVQSIVNRPRDVIVKTDPKFKYRSYFRERNLSDLERDRLLNFIQSRGDIFGVTNSFKKYLRKKSYYWLQRHQFVEHNDIKDITMLSLVVPGLIRKTLTVQAK